MFFPSIWRAMFYVLLTLAGFAGAAFASPGWLRVVLGAVGLYSLLCFFVTRSWGSFLVLCMRPEKPDADVDSRLRSGNGDGLDEKE